MLNAADYRRKSDTENGKRHPRVPGNPNMPSGCKQGSMTYVRTIVTVLLCAVLLPICSHAEILGEKIKPYVGVTGLYDSNVFRVPDSGRMQLRFGDPKMSDFLSIYTAGVDVNYPFSQQRITFSGRKDFLRFAHFDELNVTQDDYRGALKLRLFDRIVGELNGSFVKSLEPFENYTGFQKTTRTTRAAEGWAGYAFPWGLTLKGGARTQEVDYSLERLAGSEYKAKSIFTKAIYEHSTQTTFDMELRRTWYDYNRTVYAMPSQNDSTANLVQGGFSYAPGLKTLLSLHAGMMTRTYDVATWRDFHGVVGKLELKHALTEKLGMVLSAERNLAEETFLDQSYSDNRILSADLVYQIAAKTKLGIGGKLTHKDFQSSTVQITATTENRKDRIREAHAGIGWTPCDKVQITSNYRYSTRSSNYAFYDYKDHTVDFGVTYSF